MTKYIEPTGLTIPGFAKRYKLPYDCLRLFLLKKQKYKMRQKFVQQLSEATGTEPQYWYEAELEYWYDQFDMSYISIFPIEPKPVSGLELPPCPGKVLYDEFISPSNELPYRKALYGASRKTGIEESVLKGFIYGQRKINFSFAKKLASGFNTSVQYWMDLQNRCEIQAILRSKQKVSEQARAEMKSYLKDGVIPTVSTERQKEEPLNPAKVLMKCFLLPTRISLSQWCILFFLTKRNMRRFIDGKEEFSIALILKFCAVFNTSLNYWLSLQAEFYSKFDQEKTTSESLEILVEKVENPLDILNLHVKKYNWTLGAFSDHIGVKVKTLYALKQGKIEYDTATRIGLGLDMDPRIWVRLCLRHRFPN